MPDEFERVIEGQFRCKANSKLPDLQFRQSEFSNVLFTRTTTLKCRHEP